VSSRRADVSLLAVLTGFANAISVLTNCNGLVRRTQYRISCFRNRGMLSHERNVPGVPRMRVAL
jgi:hypothetical protein